MDNKDLVAKTSAKNTASIYLGSRKQNKHQVISKASSVTNLHALPTWQVTAPLPSFSGRESELSQMHEIITNQDRPGRLLVLSQALSIGNLGGVGKTEVARRYAHLYAHYFHNNAIEINAKNLLTLDESFRAAADKLGIPTIDISGSLFSINKVISWLYHYFAASSSRCLFIFDNATQYANLAPYLPPNDLSQLYVLITSRHHKWSSHGSQPIQVMTLNLWQKTQALKFVSAQLQVGVDNRAVCKLIDHYTYYLPLALRQTVACIQALPTDLPERAINDYLTTWRELTALTAESPTDNNNNYYVFITWKIAVEKIKRCQHGALAIILLNIMAYMNGQWIPKALFLELEGIVASREALEGALFLLKQYALIDEISEQTLHVAKRSVIKMHCLIQEITRLEQQALGMEWFHVDFMLELLEKALRSNKGNLTHYCLHLFYLPHAIAAYERLLSIQQKHRVQDRFEVAKLHANLGSIYRSLGDTSTAKTLLESALVLEKDEHYGQNHIKVAKVRASLGVVYQMLGDTQIACRFLEQALLVLEYSKDDIGVAKVRANLGGIYRVLGEAKKGETLLQQAYRVLKDFYGQNHIELAKLFNNLGLVYGDLRKPKQMAFWLEQALAIQEGYYNQNSAVIAQTLTDLGMAYLVLGQFKQAYAKLGQAINIFETTYAKIYADHLCLQKAKEALRCCELRLLDQSLTTESSKLLKSDDLGNYLDRTDYQKQNPAGNISQQQQLVPRYFVLDPHHQARHYHIKGQLEKAEQQFLKALEVDANAAVLADYGNFLYQQGQLDRAISYLKQAISDPDCDQCLIYNNQDRPTLDPALQKVVRTQGEITIKAVGIAYYLLVQCYAWQAQPEICTSTLDEFKQWCAAHPAPREVILWQLASSVLASIVDSTTSVALPNAMILVSSPTLWSDNHKIAMYKQKLCQGDDLNTDEWVELSRLYYRYHHDPLAAMIYIDVALQTEPSRESLAKLYKFKAEYLQVQGQDKSARFYREMAREVASTTNRSDKYQAYDSNFATQVNGLPGGKTTMLPKPSTAMDIGNRPAVFTPYSSTACRSNESLAMLTTTTVRTPVAGANLVEAISPDININEPGADVALLARDEPNPNVLARKPARELAIQKPYKNRHRFMSLLFCCRGIDKAKEQQALLSESSTLFSPTGPC